MSYQDSPQYRDDSEDDFDVDLLPDITQEDIDELQFTIARFYRMICEDEKLDALESFWKMAEEYPEIIPLFRRVHEDPSYAPRFE